jgi:hypothetical protein
MNNIPDIHTWTDGGNEVLIVKCVAKSGKSYGDFQWPLEVGAGVEAPDWDPKPERGGGLHGWPWGLAIGDGKDPIWDNTQATWLVFGARPEDVVDLQGKVKTKRGTIRYVGDWHGAMLHILGGQIRLVQARADGAASATGESGAASATGWSGAASATGERGAASATGESGAASATGWRGAASATGKSGAASATGPSGAASATGWRGAASATGWRGAASATGERGAASATGWRGAASATGESGAASATGWSGAASATGPSGAASATGWRGAASATGWSGAASATGPSGAASATGWSGAAVVTSADGRAMAGECGAIALAYWNKRKGRSEMRCAEVGSGRKGCLKPHVWYRLDGRGRFVEAKEAK